jgi:hypothetical protein
MGNQFSIFENYTEGTTEDTTEGTTKNNRDWVINGRYIEKKNLKNKNKIVYSRKCLY